MRSVLMLFLISSFIFARNNLSLSVNFGPAKLVQYLKDINIDDSLCIVTVVSKKGKMIKPTSINFGSTFEDTTATIFVEYLDSDSSSVGKWLTKDQIDYITMDFDTIRFTENTSRHIDTNYKLSPNSDTITDGVYRSITELYYNQPAYSINNIAIEYGTEAHKYKKRGVKNPGKKLEKVAWIEGKSKFLPIRGFKNKDKVYWGGGGTYYPLKVHFRYSWFRKMETIYKNVGIDLVSFNVAGVGFGLGLNKAIPVDVKKHIVIIDMESRSEHLLTKLYLKKLLKKHDPALYKEFKRQRNKDALLQEYLLKLLESLDEA